jgi:hypothetical protein
MPSMLRRETCLTQRLPAETQNLQPAKARFSRINAANYENSIVTDMLRDQKPLKVAEDLPRSFTLVSPADL